MPLTSRTLGDFTVGEKLGEGGHGVVYRAEQRTLGRAAVIKVLHARHGTHPAQVQRFLREAQLASRLDHPYAAHIYAFGAEPDGLLWIAMELVRGTTLRKLLAAQPGGRLPIARMVALLDGLCEVVHTAHELGIIHRDLKPDNVMVLSRAGRLLPKLLDLGIAKLVTDGAGAEAARGRAAAAPSSTSPPRFPDVPRPGDVDPGSPTEPDLRGGVTQAGAILGSPHYMAPEQWLEDAAIDARTDQYALGIVAFEMIAGRVPFSGGSLPEIARGHVRGALPPLPDGAPPALIEVLGRALAKRPDERFASVLAFAEAVRAAAGLRVSAEALPRLDDELRAEIAWLPQPIAEAVAELEAARNPHQARDALWQVVRVIARWLGVVALCARSRTQAGAGDPAAVTAALRELYRRDLGDAEWVELVRGLAQPFAEIRDAHPMPELVDLALAEPSPFAPVFALHATEAAATSEESLRDRLARALPVLAPLLRAVAFLASYQLIVPRRGDRDDRAEVWMGTRRSARQLIAIAPGLPAGEPVLADLDGRPVLQLAPLVQIAAPAPGAPDELFVFAGAGRIREHGARLVCEPHGFERHDDAVWRWFRAGLLGPLDDGAATVEHTPYRGLAAFTEADAAAFFGRERAACAFVNQLREQPLLAVVGPSGAGKSSFVRAGVIPGLPEGWRAVVVRPGAAPMAALAARVDLTAPPEGSDAAGEATVQVIVIDQLEELFTLCQDRAERERFAAALAHLARSANDRTRVVLTVRDDFLARIGALPALRDRLARAVTLLATPADDDLMRVLVEPARRAGYDFDDGLPERMVQTVAGQPSALALLSFTALRLWELRDRHFKRLTAASYEAIGGVEGALAQHAEDTLRACTAAEQRAVREAFRHLVTADGTRAVVSRVEIDQALGQALGTSAAARGVIDRLIDARLVVAADGDTGDRIEVIHEALLDAWPRLVEWRRDDADGARLRDQLRAAARQWQDRGRPRGLLWRDEALDDYVRWRARWSGSLPALDQAFADASTRDAARTQRIRRVLAGAAAAVAIAGIVALSLLYRSSQRSAEVASAALIDSWIQQGQRELFTGDYLRALPFLAQAYRAGDRSIAVRAMLHRALRLADQPRIRLRAETHDARFRAGGTEVLAIGAAGDAAVIDAATARVTATLDAPAGAVLTGGGAISDDGALAALPRTYRIEVWDGRASRSFPVEHPNPHARVAFDAGHTYLAVADGQSVALWSLVDGARRWSRPLPGIPRQILVRGDQIVAVTSPNVSERVAWLVSADRSAPLGPARRLAAIGDGRFVTIETARAVLRDGSGAPVVSYEIAEITAVAATRDGRRIALGQRNGVIEVVDAATGQRAGLLTGHNSAIQTLAFSPDGARLVSMAVDRNARIWSLARGRELFHYVGLDGTPVAVQVSPDGKRIAAATSEATLLVPSDDPSAELVVAMPEQIGAANFVAGGTQILTTSDSGVELWDARTGDRVAYIATSVSDGAHASPGLRWVAIPLGDAPDVEIRALPGGALRTRLHSAAKVQWAVFDHAGARLATVNATGLIELWNLDGARLAALPGHTAVAQDIEFSPDDRLLVSASNDRTARIWNAASGAELARVSHKDEVDAARFDPSGRRFATASADKYVMLWDTASGAAVGAFSHESAVRSVGLDSTYLAGATSSGAVQLWDLASGREVGRFLHASLVGSVDFAGDRMMSAGDDGRIVIWDVAATVESPEQVVARVCDLIGASEIAARDLLRCPASIASRVP